MDDDAVDGGLPLRGPGVGLVVGGLVLGWLSLAVPPVAGALVVLGLSIAWWAVGPEAVDPTRTAASIALVGAIAAIEATPIGLGIDHLLLGVFAMAFGMFDIVVGMTIARREARA